MGAWKRCPYCGGRIRILMVMGSREERCAAALQGEIDPSREAWQCLNPKCKQIIIVKRGVVLAHQAT